jgi:hypothetical protein
MPLGQIDAGSQRSAPGFPAILTRFATDLASILRITLLSDSRIASSSSTTRPWSPLARHPILPPASFAFVRRQREPKGRAMPHHWTLLTGGLREPPACSQTGSPGLAPASRALSVQGSGC